MASLLTSVFYRDGAVDGVPFVLQYLESFVGRYAVMFTLPFFVHRLFGVDSKRDRVILAITLVTAAAQHLTEFGLGGRWDEAGDVFEDVVFAGVLAYTLWIGLSRRTVAGRAQDVVNRFLVLMVLSVPGTAYDLFFRSDTAWRFYPLWYSVTSVVMTLTLLRHPTHGAIPASWGLSDREQEVVQLVQRGLSNKGVARELEISPNTVKTHLRSVYDKSGIRTRYGLMAALNVPADSTDDGPGG
jgi:DNA-binding CsgD family transcriptional regulator